jgi:ribosome-associated toxin RatA of RatAB toxin-antitoxin module
LDTSITRRVRADPDVVFQLASAVEDWPRILPHYRWVRILGDDGHGCRTVEMAARRDVLGRVGFPLRWTAVQTVHPADRRIEFEHVHGITRGMYVTWTIDAALGEVVIRHVFRPAWPVPDSLVHLIVGEYFVNGVARRTLRRIGQLAEARAGFQQPDRAERS